MHVGWMIPQDLGLASYRYRCMIPMRELKKVGVKCSIGEGQVMVFAKHFVPDAFDMARHVKSHGGKVVFDVSDNHFDNLNEYYTKMIHVSDAVTCPTNAMAMVIKAMTGRDAHVISDPYEYPQADADSPVKTKHVLWFGHPTNIDSIRREAGNLGDRKLLVVSGEGCYVDGAKNMKWSREGMIHAFAWADVVILPIDLSDKTKVKSPNRLIESARQGKYVVANYLEAYKPYGMWLGDIREGLDWVDAHPEEAAKQLDKARKIIEQHNSPAEIAARWYEVFKTCLSPHTRN